MISSVVMSRNVFPFFVWYVLLNLGNTVGHKNLIEVDLIQPSAIFTSRHISSLQTGTIELNSSLGMQNVFFGASRDLAVIKCGFLRLKLFWHF